MILKPSFFVIGTSDRSQSASDAARQAPVDSTAGQYTSKTPAGRGRSFSYRTGRGRVQSRLLSLAFATAVVPGLILSSPAADAATGYHASNGKIYDPSGQELQVRGINHFGFNNPTLQPQYLWSQGWKEQIAQMKELGFNAVRVPFVPDTLYDKTPLDQLSYIDASKNPDLIGKTSLEVLDMWMDEANRQGLYVMLDFHSITKERLYPTWFVNNPDDYHLIYNNKEYTKEHWLRDLRFVAERYGHLEHFFAVDLYNEPNGPARWTEGDTHQTDPQYYWKDAAEDGAQAVLDANPDLLIFVQGSFYNYDGREDSDIPMNWAENFQPQAYAPLEIPSDKLVLSPHTYGPDVAMKETFGHGDYPNNLPQYWDTLFGQFVSEHPVIPSEWGGWYGIGNGGQQDVVWQNAFVDYMASKGMNSSFYWTFSHNSHDTGGILDDNGNVREDKMELLRRHWGGDFSQENPAPQPQPQPEPQPAPPTGNGSLSSCANILPLGDSITLGVNGGYRNKLYSELQALGCGVSFVGSQYDENTRVDDRDHEGHSGYSITDISNEIDGWLGGSDAEIVLLMAGTNDTAWWTAESGEQIAARHDALIEKIQNARPGAWVFVASIPPQTSQNIQPNNVDRAQLTEQFNSAVRDNANRRANAGENVRFVDVNSVLSTGDLYDGIHPDEEAHGKIANEFLKAIRAEFSGTAPAPQPQPQPQPKPEPQPQPQPEPKPQPEPQPEPQPAPAPSPAPQPEVPASPAVPAEPAQVKQSKVVREAIAPEGLMSAMDVDTPLRSEQISVNVTLQADSADALWSDIELGVISPTGRVVVFTEENLVSETTTGGVSQRSYVSNDTGVAPSQGEWKLVVLNNDSQNVRRIDNWDLQIDGTALPQDGSKLPASCTTVDVDGVPTDGLIRFGISQRGQAFQQDSQGGNSQDDYYVMADVEAGNHSDIIAVVQVDGNYEMLTENGLEHWDGNPATLKGLPNAAWNSEGRPMVSYVESLNPGRMEIFFGFHNEEGQLNYCANPMVVDLD